MFASKKAMQFIQNKNRYR